MKWDKYTIDTTTEAEDFISMMLSENGIEGIEIEDNVPLTDTPGHCSGWSQNYPDMLPYFSTLSYCFFVIYGSLIAASAWTSCRYLLYLSEVSFFLRIWTAWSLLLLQSLPLQIRLPVLS
jgi:hypothetical protein